jgi:hypothetical protein
MLSTAYDPSPSCLSGRPSERATRLLDSGPVAQMGERYAVQLHVRARNVAARQLIVHKLLQRREYSDLHVSAHGFELPGNQHGQL